MRYIKGLDSIRAVAVLLVIYYHYGPKFSTETPLGSIAAAAIPDGKFGVNIFFVLSGFLITSILLAAKEDALHSRGTIIKNFFIRRTLRIFPIYYLCFFALKLTNFPFPEGGTPYYLTYTSNFLVFQTQDWDKYAHTWSLAVEEQFYLIWPWLIIFISNRHLKYVFALFILTGIVSSYVVQGILGNPMSVLPVECFDAFGIGGLYAFLQGDKVLAERFRKIIKMLAIPAVAIYLVLIRDMFSLHYQGLNMFERTIGSIISIWLIDAAINSKSKVAGKLFLNNPVFNFIGRISYGLYLYHGPLLGICNYPIKYGLVTSGVLYELLTGPVSMHLIRLAVLFGVAYTSYTLIELPILRLKKYFNYHRSGEASK